MCQPLRLPCGLAVDAVTLEKYYAEEAKFGRLPNDPFTGITFNENFKPLSDAALKARISAFLSQNSNDPTFNAVPRTLGGCTATITYSQFKNPNYYARLPSVNAVSTVKSSTVTRNNYDSDDDFRGPGFPSRAVSPKPKSIKSASTTTRLLTSDDHMNYELLKMLSGGSNYLAKSKPKALELERSCKDCGLVMSMKRGITSFYIAHCDHVILCKMCLSKTDKQARKTCTQCGTEWRAKDCLRILI